MATKKQELTYLERWTLILKDAGLTDAQIANMCQILREEIEPLKSRLKGMEQYQVDTQRSIQKMINDFHRDVDRQILNQTPYKVFLDFKEEMRSAVSEMRNSTTEIQDAIADVLLQDQIIPQAALEANLS